MSTMLTKGMFDNGRYFGIKSGIMRPWAATKAKKMAHNATWYNKVGERLGYGDLDIADIVNIRDGIPQNEVFFILPESAGFRENIGDLDRYAPGKDFCLQQCVYAIFRGRLYGINDYEPRSGSSVTLGEGLHKVEIHYIEREKLLMHLAALRI